MNGVIDDELPVCNAVAVAVELDNSAAIVINDPSLRAARTCWCVRTDEVEAGKRGHVDAVAILHLEALGIRVG